MLGFLGRVAKNMDEGVQGDVRKMHDVKSKVQADIGLCVLACEVGSDSNEGVGGNMKMGELLQRFQKEGEGRGDHTAQNGRFGRIG
jgi:hypothetical protein